VSLLIASKLIGAGRGLAPAVVRRAGRVALDWDSRQKSRFEAVDSAGRRIGVFLPRGRIVRGGDVLVVDDGSLLVVDALDQPILVVTPAPNAAPNAAPGDAALAIAKASYHLGNRHVPLEVHADRLVLEPDHVLAELLVRMGLRVEAARGPFEPEAGAYDAGSSATAHAHAHGHTSDSGSHAAVSSGSGASHGAAHPPEGATAREAAAGFTFHKDEKKGSKTPLIGGLAAVLLIAAAGGAWFLKGRAAAVPPPSTLPPPTTMSPEMVALAQKAKELEEKLQALEAEKAAASAKAEEDAKKKVEAQAKARGQAVDPEALARAQDEARKKAQAEQERKAQAERKRLEDEQRALAEQQAAEEQRRAEEARAAAAAAAAAPPTTVAAATPPPPPTTVAIKPGTLVDVNDVGVIAPVALNKPSFTYPPIALRQRIEGKVDLSVLVDERGGVTDAKVISGAGGRAGLNEAASDYVKRWKFRPATKEGVPVKTWTPVSVVFMLPR